MVLFLPWWGWVLIALGWGVAGTASASPGTVTGSGSPELARLRSMAAHAGVDSDWITFLSAVAHHESHWYPTAHNQSSGEVRASAAAYERNAAHFAACGRDPAEYAIGSGGWYGLLPANALVGAFRGTPAICTDPRAIFDPWVSTLLAVSYARNLLGWSSFQRSDRSWLALNRGWALPGSMDEPRPDTDARFLRALRAQGVPESFAKQRVTALPPNWHAFTYLGAGSA